MSEYLTVGMLRDALTHADGDMRIWIDQKTTKKQNSAQPSVLLAYSTNDVILFIE